LKRIAGLGAVALIAAYPGPPLSSEAPSPTLPANAHLLRGAAAEQVFRQCSRGAPEFVAADFEPDAGSIRDLEAKLPAALTAAGNRLDYRGAGAPLDLDAYYREYAAYLSAGRRKIYGNFAPLGIGAGDRRGPVMICDGGPAFFGVEYDVERGEITGLAFNGVT
jgi:hypothetical protein